ncbi:MAG: hypothetical protein K5785_00915 [Nitrosarchaeum sp.]|nr:hypothetical protein [Nitrosarchaeum sp.]
MLLNIDGQEISVGKGNDAIDEANSLVDDYSPSSLVLPKESILRDYEKFFAWAGGVLHPKLREKDGRPVRILKPFWYQTKFANMKRAVMLGSNKLAKTKGELIRDIQTRLWPENAGFDMLLVGQNQTMADEHLLNAKKWMLQSPTLRPFLITRPDQRFRLPEEKSKMKMLYVENPYEPENPSRMIAIGFSESLAYSWEKVNRLHISDPGQNSRKNQISFFSGLYSRLSNTEGDIKIEGVAGERSGYFYELCRQLFPEQLQDDYEDEQDILDPERGRELQMEELHTMASSFDKMFLTADDGVKVGIISKAWLSYMKGILPHDEFMRIYYCVFSKPQGTIFDDIRIGEHEPLGAENILGY